MFLDIHLYIKRNHEIYDLGEIKQNDDGSLYIFLPTNESKNKFKKLLSTRQEESILI